MPEESDIDKVWEAWKGYLFRESDTRYKRSERKIHLEVLADMLYNAGIDKKEADTLQINAMKEVTTEEGRKGKNNYKGWKEACLEDFAGAIASQYYPYDPTTTKANGSIDVKIEPFVPDPGIKNWINDVYGDNDQILQQAHVCCNIYNLMYLDFLESVN